MHFCKFSLSLADPPGRGPTRLGTSGDGWQIQREKIENIKSTSESLTVETTVSPGWLGLVFPNKEEDKPVVDGNTPSHHHTSSIYSSWPGRPLCLSLGICNPRAPTALEYTMPEHGLIQHSL